jgi:hypothetical protein
MPFGELIPEPYRLFGKAVLLTTLVGGSAAIAWQVQDWRYGKQLAEQARLRNPQSAGPGLGRAAACRTRQTPRARAAPGIQ